MGNHRAFIERTTNSDISFWANDMEFFSFPMTKNLKKEGFSPHFNSLISLLSSPLEKRSGTKKRTKPKTLSKTSRELLPLKQQRKKRVSRPVHSKSFHANHCTFGKHLPKVHLKHALCPPPSNAEGTVYVTSILSHCRSTASHCTWPVVATSRGQLGIKAQSGAARMEVQPADTT